MPNNIKSVSVSLFENKTSSSDASQIFTNAMIYEFNKKNINIVSKEKAEAKFYGIIEKVIVSSLSRTETTTISKKIEASITASLIDKKGETIWQKTVSRYEIFNFTTDTSTNEKNEKDALIKLAEKISASIYMDLTSNF